MTSLTPAVTGAQTETQAHKVTYPFERYEIEVIVSDTGMFLGISGIKLKTDFLTHAQKLSTASFHDVEQYYQEENK